MGALLCQRKGGHLFKLIRSHHFCALPANASVLWCVGGWVAHCAGLETRGYKLSVCRGVFPVERLLDFGSLIVLLIWTFVWFLVVWRSGTVPFATPSSCPTLPPLFQCLNGTTKGLALAAVLSHALLLRCRKIGIYFLTHLGVLLRHL